MIEVFSSSKKKDVILICMPYADIFRPSLALGNIQAVLQQEGVTVESIYANFLFAEYFFDRFGKDAWQFITQSRVLELVGEWSFSHLLFSERDNDVNRFIDLLQKRHWLYREYSRSCLFRYLTHARKASSDFIDSLVDKIISHSPRIVGCSSTFEQHCPSLAVLKKLKKRSPEITTIMGGANCESIMGLTTHQTFAWIDFVVSGECEDNIAPLVRLIMEKGDKITAKELPYAVFGPVHRITSYPLEGEDRRIPPRAVVGEMDAIPVPDFDDYYRTVAASRVLKRFVRPGLLMESSRGCWWGEKKSCTFCGLNGCGNRYRCKSPQTVIRQLDILANRYDINNFAMTDNIFSHSYYETVLPELKEKGSPYKIFYETKANLSEDQIKSFSESGMTWIQPGIESLSTPMLKLMNKGCSAWQNLRTLKWCRQYGVRIQWFILWDFPHDKEDWYRDMAELIPFITHFQPPVAMLAMIINRFSYYHENADSVGLDISPVEPYSSIYKLPDETISNLAYFFENDAQQQLKQDSFLSRLLDRKAIAQLRKELAKWIVPFNRGEEVMLTMQDDNNGILRIWDTRPGAQRPYFELQGVARELYLACDNPVSVKTVRDQLSLGAKNINKFDVALDLLITHRLLVQIDGRLLALALRKPVARLPDYSAWPGGSLTDEFRSRPSESHFVWQSGGERDCYS